MPRNKQRTGAIRSAWIGVVVMAFVTPVSIGSAQPADGDRRSGRVSYATVISGCLQFEIE